MAQAGRSPVGSSDELGCDLVGRAGGQINRWKMASKMVVLSVVTDRVGDWSALKLILDHAASRKGSIVALLLAGSCFTVLTIMNPDLHHQSKPSAPDSRQGQAPAIYLVTTIVRNALAHSLLETWTI